MAEITELPPGHKQCSGSAQYTCGRVLPLDQFYRNKGMADGYLKQCKDCHNRRTREYERKNRAAVNARHAAWRKRNPDKRKASQRRYVDANREATLERTKKWQRENRERVNKVRNARRHTHPEQARAEWRTWNRVRKARIRGAQIREPIDPDVVYERDNGICHLCGTLVNPNNWHLDHIQPISRGGNHTYENVAVSHPFCNMSKGATEMTPSPTPTMSP